MCHFMQRACRLQGQRRIGSSGRGYSQIESTRRQHVLTVNGGAALMAAGPQWPGRGRRTRKGSSHVQHQMPLRVRGSRARMFVIPYIVRWRCACD